MPRKPKKAKIITPGPCAFKGCYESRIIGEWLIIGSLMCEEHRDLFKKIKSELDNENYIDDDDDVYKYEIIEG